MRSIKQSIFGLKTQNKTLWGALAASLTLALLVIYVPFLAAIFSLEPLSAKEVIVSLGLAVSVVPFIEIVKAIQRRTARIKAAFKVY
jgi:Ca2+-transporting ATPase